MTTIVRLLDTVEATATFAAVALPGLPPPRFAAVAVVEAGDGIAVEPEVRRGPVPADAPFLMMSFARRAVGLSRDGFAERWRAEAGSMGGEVLPDGVRGLAYVQLHPVGDDPPFDAVNQVFFADLDGLRRRAEWFAARPVPADLFDPASAFALYLRRA